MIKLPLIALFFSLGSALVSAQSLEAVVAIGDKAACTVADLKAMSQAFVDAFPEDLDLALRLEKALAKYKDAQKLTKAKAAFVAAKSLKVRSSLFFLLIPWERYAFRAFVVDGIFSSVSSGGDVMSGLDLMDFVSAVSMKYGVTQ